MFTLSEPARASATPDTSDDKVLSRRQDIARSTRASEPPGQLWQVRALDTARLPPDEHSGGQNRDPLRFSSASSPRSTACSQTSRIRTHCLDEEAPRSCVGEPVECLVELFVGHDAQVHATDVGHVQDGRVEDLDRDRTGERVESGVRRGAVRALPAGRGGDTNGVEHLTSW
jgi:hypothetical protein